MWKWTVPFFMTITAVGAQESLLQEELSLFMCGEASYRFDGSSKECVYCAHGLHYDGDQKCVGTPDLLGKCKAGHHYHAATQECMFCAQGFAFNQTSRGCEKNILSIKP